MDAQANKEQNQWNTFWNLNANFIDVYIQNSDVNGIGSVIGDKNKKSRYLRQKYFLDSNDAEIQSILDLRILKLFSSKEI